MREFKAAGTVVKLLLRRTHAARRTPVSSGATIRSFVLSLGFVCSLVAIDAQRTSPAIKQTLTSQLHQAIVTAELGDEERALAVTREILAQHQSFEPALKFQGALLEDMGHGPEAAASYEAALKLAPSDPELLFKVGIYQLETGHHAAAIGLFVRALKYAPRDRDTLFYLAQAYHLNGNNELALKTIQECLKVDPSNASVWQKYGELLCSSGDNQAALHWFLKAQQADPTLDRIDFDLGVANYRSMEGTMLADWVGVGRLIGFRIGPGCGVDETAK